jgi:hypothetical protein
MIKIMITLEQALEKLNSFPSIIIAEVNSDDFVAKINSLEQEFGDISLIPSVLFFITGDLDINLLYKFLMREESLEESQARKIQIKIKDEIYQPLLKKFYFLNDNIDKKLSFNDEKDYARVFFQNNLLAEIKKHKVIVEAINKRIFFILSKDFDFKKELEKSLYNNNQILSNKKFVLENRTTNSTVGNWLKDFIGKYGTDMFDNVILIEYLNKAENVKLLDAEEKELLGKLLRLYRNIKFFPLSMPTDSGEGWEILPISTTSEELAKARTVSGPPLTDGEKEIKQMEKVSGDYSDGTLEKQALTEEIVLAKRLEELRYLANKFPAGSLERKAIEEEIGRLA